MKFPQPPSQASAQSSATTQQATPAYYVRPAGAYAAGTTGYRQNEGSFRLPELRKSNVGVGALVLAFAALAISTIGIAVIGFWLGYDLGDRLLSRWGRTGDWTILSPVRMQVLWAEIAFWCATALGTWALIQGFAAIVTRRGRSQGIAAVVIAVLTPLVFYGVLMLAVTLGASLSGMLF